MDVRCVGSLTLPVPRFSLLQWILVLCAGGCVGGWVSAWMRLGRLLRPDEPKWKSVMQPWMWQVENYIDEETARRTMWAYRGWLIGLFATIVALATTLS